VAVVRDTQVWIAFIGLVGVIAGAVIAVVGSVLLHWLQDRKTNQLDQARMELLKQLLVAQDWRKLSTLARVVGADADTTKRLLINLGARVPRNREMMEKKSGV